MDSLDHQEPDLDLDSETIATFLGLRTPDEESGPDGPSVGYTIKPPENLTRKATKRAAVAAGCMAISVIGATTIHIGPKTKTTVESTSALEHLGVDTTSIRVARLPIFAVGVADSKVGPFFLEEDRWAREYASTYQEWHYMNPESLRWELVGDPKDTTAKPYINIFTEENGDKYNINLGDGNFLVTATDGEPCSFDQTKLEWTCDNVAPDNPLGRMWLDGDSGSLTTASGIVNSANRGFNIAATDITCMAQAIREADPTITDPIAYAFRASIRQALQNRFGIPAQLVRFSIEPNSSLRGLPGDTFTGRIKAAQADDKDIKLWDGATDSWCMSPLETHSKVFGKVVATSQPHPVLNKAALASFVEQLRYMGMPIIPDDMADLKSDNTTQNGYAKARYAAVRQLVSTQELRLT